MAKQKPANPGDEQAPQKPSKASAPTYEEWRMENVNGKLEKLKLIRSGVKITEAEAATLNAGANLSSQNPVKYFKSE